MRHAESLEKLSNADWTQDNEAPDPSPLPKVVGWTILVRPVSVHGKTKGSIILPDQTKDDVAYLTTVGRVLAMGSLAYDRPDMHVNGVKVPWCAVGDYVGYGKFAGKKVTYKGVKLLLINDDDVKLVVDSPASLDPFLNYLG